ncbi:MAG: coproporphyrinogen dehydrogenase HemZ [Clostridiales bacterium]|nr:coproporphyrinogen dehydrogenase HemZ [Clostridiales bacterium]
MVKVFLIGYDYKYEIREFLKLFYPANSIEIITDIKDSTDILNKDYKNDIIISELKIKNNIITARNKIINVNKSNFKETINNIQINKNENETKIKKLIKILLKSSLFKLLQTEKNKYIPWGILTGIRPVKIAHGLMDENKTDDEIIEKLVSDKLLKKEKALLLLEIAKRERPYVYPIDKNKVSLYISIPFCPSRCIYCSFPSNSLSKYYKYKSDYLKALFIEINATANLIKEKNKKIETIYIGGGTPTCLDSDEISILIGHIIDSFNLKDLKEFTVEAGRPDTINIEKLKILKDKGVTRISINPQTMNDITLKRIGRNHSAIDVIKAYEMAEKIGFKNINMDIILGLPGENIDMLIYTMDEIKKLAPNNLTVHTLAIKRTSKLEKENYEDNNTNIVDMLEISKEYCENMGLKPYYLYRQKHMLGNLENIGYAIPGNECIYNIQIMEEKQSIIAMGAGAVSKIVFPDEDRLERVPNIKDLITYMDRVAEMPERKKIYLI